LLDKYLGLESCSIFDIISSASRHKPSFEDLEFQGGSWPDKHLYTDNKALLTVIEIVGPYTASNKNLPFVTMDRVPNFRV
jgi:hypothetical protein